MKYVCVVIVMICITAYVAGGAERVIQPGVTEENLVAPHLTSSGHSPKAQGDFIWGFPHWSPYGFGVEFACDSFFTTDFGYLSVDVYDRNGNWCYYFDQFRTPDTWLDLAWDGDTLYAADHGDYLITKFGRHGEDYGDFPGPLSGHTALAYDPATDHFWAAAWSSPICEFTKTGAIINVYPNSYSIAGMAWDDVSPGGPWLWVFAQDGPSPYFNTVYQFDPSSGVYTGVSYWRPMGTACYAGGCCFTTDWDPSMAILFTLCQSDVDSVYGIEICRLGSIHPGWNIIALPVIPDNPDPDSCFGDDIPFVNIFGYDEPSKSYNSPLALEMGKGYMLQSLWVDILDVTGTPVSLPFTIAGLTKSFPNSYYGWNLAGNPVNDTIDFDGLTFDNVNFLYKYFNGYNYTFYPGGGEDNLIPDWMGFWVQVIDPGMGSITVDAPAVLKGKSEPVCWEWRLKVSAKSGELIDEHNYIGVSSDERALDVVDFLVPLSEYVQVYFEGEEAGYQQLVLDGEQDTYEIPFDVEVNTSNPEVTISWEFEVYPEGMGVYLVDGETEIDMRETSSYTFQNSYEGGGSEIPTLEDPVLLLSRKAQGEIHYFTIRVEPLLGVEDGEVGLLTTICGIHPNPLTRDAMIDFVLSKRMEVNLGVYDVSGRLIKNLVDGVMDSGEHSVIWDGSDLAGGVYFIKMHTGEVSVTKKAIVLR